VPYLLDTNVVSELRKAANASPRVLAWRRSVTYEETYISVLLLGEMRRGVELKKGKDPAAARVFEKWLREIRALHKERILDVTEEICEKWGRMAAHANVSIIDGLMAATAAQYDLTVVTRNARDFQRCGVDYLNPFEH